MNIIWYFKEFYEFTRLPLLKKKKNTKRSGNNYHMILQLILWQQEKQLDYTINWVMLILWENRKTNDIKKKFYWFLRNWSSFIFLSPERRRRRIIITINVIMIKLSGITNWIFNLHIINIYIVLKKWNWRKDLVSLTTKWIWKYWWYYFCV